VPKCLPGVTAVRRYLGVVAKFLGFLLGVAVALAGPAVFGVLAAPGGIELNAKGMALAFGIGALIFWAVVSYFSGAGALGAFAAFGTLVYCWLWIPNRTTNFLNDVPGVTTGMIEGSKQYTLNGVVPILGVISLVYAIQLIVQSVQRRRRERADAERLQREQEAAQAQQEADVASVYPVAGGTYQPAAPAYESRSRYDDLFDDPEPVQPRNQADDQTRPFPVAAEFDHTRQFAEPDADSNYTDETVVAAAPENQAPENQAAEHQAADEEVGQGTTSEADGSEDTQPMTPQSASAHTPNETQAAQSAPTADAQSGGTPPAGDSTAGQTSGGAADGAADGAATGGTAGSASAGSTGDESVGNATADETTVVEGGEQEKGGSPEKDGQGGTQQRVGGQEEVGSQYRERMEDPEDTGEFHLAFENPIVRPA
jgi:hypothetical protein